MKLHFDFELNADDIETLHGQCSEVEVEDDRIIIYTENLLVDFEEFITPWLNSGFSLSYRERKFMICYIDLLY